MEAFAASGRICVISQTCEGIECGEQLVLRGLGTVSNDIYSESSDERSKRPGCLAIHGNLFDVQGYLVLRRWLEIMLPPLVHGARRGAPHISGRPLADVWRHEQGDEFGQSCGMASGYRRPGLRCE